MKIGVLKTKGWDLNEKLGVSNEIIGVFNEKL